MPPQSFGRYEVQEEIGDGAMGRVYRAFDPLVRRLVAIKTVKSEHLTRDTTEEYLRRFRREAQAAGGLAHPAIVSIFDVGPDYFVMEFLEGETLQAVLKQRGCLPVPEALKILTPVAEALDFAHRSGIIHRDIKPANIMVLADGRPKLMDFGVAHLDSTIMTSAGQLLGSPSYMAPEQIKEGSVTARADLFSLATVAYETVTGQRPFRGENITSIIYRVMNENPAPPRQVNFALPTRYDDVFRRALAKEPEARYPSASAFVAAMDLREFESLLPGESAAPPSDRDLGTGTIADVPAVGGETHATTSLGAPVAGDPPTESLPTMRATRAPRGNALGLGLAAVVLALGVAFVLKSRQAPAPDPSPTPAAEDGGLRVETEPEGAVVQLDGKEVGAAPLTLRDVPPGPHRVRVTRQGFAPAELSLELTAGAPPPPLRFVIQPVMGQVRIVSEPSDATVRVDGKPAGQTPIESLWLDPGPREVRVERTGFRPYVQRLQVKVGDQLSVEARLAALEDKAAEIAATPAPTPSPTPAALVEGALVELTEEVVRPKKLSGDAPRYPEVARRLRIVGTVTVDAVVTEHGTLTDLRVTESGGEVLDKAALEALRSWRYEPATKAGVKVKVHLPIRLTFREGN